MSKRQRVDTERKGDKDRMSLLPQDYQLQVVQLLAQQDIPSMARLAKMFRRMAVSVKLVFKEHKEHADTVAQVEAFVYSKSKEALARVLDVTVDVPPPFQFSGFLAQAPDFFAPTPDTFDAKTQDRLVAALRQLPNLKRLTCPRAAVAAALIEGKAMPALRALIVERGSPDKLLQALGTHAPESIAALSCTAVPAQIAALPAEWLGNLERLRLCGYEPILAADVRALLHAVPNLTFFVVTSGTLALDADWVKDTFKAPCSRKITTFVLFGAAWTAPADQLTVVATHCPLMEHVEIHANTGPLQLEVKRDPMDILPALRIWSSTLRHFRFGIFQRAETSAKFLTESEALVPLLETLELFGFNFSFDDDPFAEQSFGADITAELLATWNQKHPKLSRPLS